MKRIMHGGLAILMVLMLMLGMVVEAVAASDYLTADLTVSEGQVSVTGSTTSDTYVTILVTRVRDGNKNYMDQTRSDENGNYSFSFPMEEGYYRAVITSNGLTVLRDFHVKNVLARDATVRVEGVKKTLLPEVEIEILEGETTLLEAVTKALELGGVDYVLTGDFIHSIDGEEGWQWMVNGVGGMHVPSDLIRGGDEVVLVDALVWNPVITKLSLSDNRVSVGDEFTVTLYEAMEDSVTPIRGQKIVFSDKEETTNRNGEVTFKAAREGNYYITADTTGSYIAPIPQRISVGRGQHIPVPDPRIRVNVRIEGYKGTHFNGVVSFDPEDYKNSSGQYEIKSPDGDTHYFSRPSVLLATIVAWNRGRIRDNSIGYNDNYVARMAGEEEFDFAAKHPTCGWLVRVNNVLINQGAGVWPIEDGDEVVWYYGDLDSHYGSIHVSPTTLDPGESIRVKVTGQSNMERNFGGSGSRVNIEGATVYVGRNEYTTDRNGEVEIEMDRSGTYQVYAVKLDKNSKNGNHYFPLVSRTEKIDVVVRGDAAPPVQLPEILGEDPLKTIQEYLKEAGTLALTGDNAIIENGRLIMFLDPQEIKNVLNNLKDILEEIKEQGLYDAEELAWLKNKITITVPDGEYHEVVVKIPPAIQEILKEIEGIEIVTDVSNFNITKETFKEEDKAEGIVLAAKIVEASDLSARVRENLSAGSVVVDITAKANDKDIRSFNKPMRVGIPYEGNKQNEEALTVFHLHADGTIEAVGGMYNASKDMVVFFTNHFSKYFAKESIEVFIDMMQHPWAREAVETLAGKGIVNGINNENYGPADNITRAEFSALITRMLKYEEYLQKRLPFRDVSQDNWYYEAIASAYGNKLIQGKSAEIFDPNGDITRQEMAVIIANVLVDLGFKPGEEEELADFKDKNTIADWANESAALVVREGIITGMTDGRFAPTQNATRAEAAVMLYRLYHLILMD